MKAPQQKANGCRHEGQRLGGVTALGSLLFSLFPLFPLFISLAIEVMLCAMQCKRHARSHCPIHSMSRIIGRIGGRVATTDTAMPPHPGALVSTRDVCSYTCTLPGSFM